MLTAVIVVTIGNGEDASPRGRRGLPDAVDCEISNRAIAPSAMESGRLQWNDGVGSTHRDEIALGLTVQFLEGQW